MGIRYGDITMLDYLNKSHPIVALSLLFILFVVIGWEYFSNPRDTLSGWRWVIAIVIGVDLIDLIFKDTLFARIIAGLFGIVAIGTMIFIFALRSKTNNNRHY
jgi:uncharacterized membrane protein YuzA (DUF378 family)